MGHDMASCSQPTNIEGISMDSVDNEIVPSEAVLEAKLRHCEEQLAQAKAELVDFASIVAHDLRSPLLTVSGYSDLLVHDFGDRLNESAEHYLRSIVDGVGRANRLIEDLSRYAQLRCLGCPSGTVELDRVFSDVLGNLECMIRESQAAIRVDSLPTVRGNHGDLVHLFQNLVDNAIKFHDTEPPIVEVTSTFENGGNTIRVADNGIGIEPEHYETVFRVLHRLPKSRNLPGSGIGLAICKKIVDCYEGRIWIESEQGRGTTFLVWLPDA